jgi:hypothetical protein
VKGAHFENCSTDGFKKSKIQMGRCMNLSIRKTRIIYASSKLLVATIVTDVVVVVIVIAMPIVIAIVIVQGVVEACWHTRIAMAMDAMATSWTLWTLWLWMLWHGRYGCYRGLPRVRGGRCRRREAPANAGRFQHFRNFPAVSRRSLRSSENSLVE